MGHPFRRGLFAALVLTFLAQTVAAQAPAPAVRPVPDFTVEIFGEPVTDFGRKVNVYFELRAQLERHLPPVVVTDNPALIIRGERMLAREIRLSRPGARQGEFFTDRTSTGLRADLALIMTASIWEAIMEENPGTFRSTIGGAYPDGKAHGTMPGVVLAVLPQLPKDVEFRFVGSDLILYDVRANTIVDRLPYAIVCRGCPD